VQSLRRVVGRIAKPHGVRGEVQVEIRTDEPELRFKKGSHLIAGEQLLKIQSAKFHGKYMLVKFEEFDTRNDVEELRNLMLEVEVDPTLTPDADDEFYDYQLISLDVLVNNQKVGITKEVLHLPGQDVIVIDKAGVDILVPFVKEIVTEVDITAGTVTLNPPIGLLEDVIDEN
jgi:16S rRNA processing protein RimM